MSSEESLSVRSISVDVETPETEQVMATVAGLAKLGSMDGGAPLSPPDFSLLHSTPPGGGCGDPEEPEVSADATPVEENNKGSGDDRGTIPLESISKMSTTSSSESEGEEEEGGREEGGGGGGGEITSEMRYRRSRE